MRRAREQGVAVVTALLLTTLAISIVASLFWQQQVQVRSMENQRLHLQTKWIQRGALDWAGVILRQPASYVSLDQVWATPLAETRLDQYIERERLEGETYNASLSGQIFDAAARYNLNNLANGGVLDRTQLTVLERLLANLRLAPQLARPIAEFVAAGQTLVPVESSGGDEGTPAPVPVARRGTPMPVLRVEDLLAVRGVTPEVVERLRPYVIVLSSSNTKVNANTAEPEVLAAVLPGYSLDEARALSAELRRVPSKGDAYLRERLKTQAQGADVRIAVTSDYFLVQSRIRLDRAALSAETLVQVTEGYGLRNVNVLWTRQN